MKPLQPLHIKTNIKESDLIDRPCKKCTQRQFTAQLYNASIHIHKNSLLRKCTQGLDSDRYFNINNKDNVHIRTLPRNVHAWTSRATSLQPIKIYKIAKYGNLTKKASLIVCTVKLRLEMFFSKISFIFGINLNDFCI